jgi:hypothetical protein
MAPCFADVCLTIPRINSPCPDRVANPLFQCIGHNISPCYHLVRQAQHCPRLLHFEVTINGVRLLIPDVTY